MSAVDYHIATTNEEMTLYQYEGPRQHGERVLVASFREDVYSKIDAANGWHEPRDAVTDRDEFHAANIKVSADTMSWVFDQAQLDKLHGMMVAQDRFLIVLQSRGHDVGSKVDLPDRLRSAHVIDDHCVVLDHLLDWCVGKIKKWTAKAKSRAFVKYLCATWMVRPALLSEQPGTGVTLSLELLGRPLKRTRCWLSMVAEQFGHDFKIQSRNQKRLSTRAAYSAATKKAWEKRRKTG